MPVLTASHLRENTFQIFRAAGASDGEARIVASSLVEANLAGLDSHGVLRIPQYIGWIEKRLLVLDAKTEIVSEDETYALVDGGWGFGQVAGRRATKIAMEKAGRSGVAAVCLRRSCHLGRVADYALMAAQAGMIAIAFVNSPGPGRLMSPWGGIERRLGANPIAVGIPTFSGEPVVVDISTSSIAEGKVRSLLNRGMAAPPGCIIDASGKPSTAPADYFGPPSGALLPFGEHKGFALALVTDMLAGALSGGGCSSPEPGRPANNLFVVVIDVKRFREREAFHADVSQLIDYVKSSKLADGFSEILIPGEPEIRQKNNREKHGIPVDEETWRQIVEAGRRYGLDIASASQTP